MRVLSPWFVRIALVASFAVTIVAVVPAPFRGASERATLDRPSALAQGRVGGVAPAFVPNLGQWAHPGRYVARLGRAALFVEDDGLVLSATEHAGSGARACERGAAVRLRFAGARAAELVPEQRLTGRHSYFLGSDPVRWRGDVPRYGAVRWRGVYPGVDVRLWMRGGQPEYDVEVAPGADLSRVEVQVEGAERLRIDAEGALVLDTALGPVRQPPPATWELDADGERRALACGYELRGPRRYGFVVPDWSRAAALVVDPGLVWSTFLGGSKGDAATGVAVDASGVVTVAGGTQSPGFPATMGAWDRTHNGSTDVVVVRLDPSRPAGQQLLYATFIGGSSADGARALAVDASGVATITGLTLSADYPTTPGAWNRKYSGLREDAFVTRIDPSRPATQQLVYSTYVGSALYGDAKAIAVDARGVVTIAGHTASPAYPTTKGAWSTKIAGKFDLFVSRLDPSLPAAKQLVYSTFLGGAELDFVGGLAIDAKGRITIAGWTESRDYPTTPSAWSRGLKGKGDAFVSRLDPSLPAAKQLTYSTFLGGFSKKYSEFANAVAVDGAGIITVAGSTPTLDFPTTPGAWGTKFSGTFGVFVSRLDPARPAAQQLVYSTIFGGWSGDRAEALVVDAAGVITIAGWAGPGYPTTPGAWSRTTKGFYSDDAFVTRLDPSRPTKQQLVYSTYVGGWSLDAAFALAVDGNGAATIAGMTRSNDFPTTPNAWSRRYAGNEDAFVARLDLLPTGVRAYGTSSPGCAGPLAIGVSSWPQVGNRAFSLTCTNAPPSTTGAALLASAGRATPLVVLGAKLWVEPRGAFFVAAPARSGPAGQADLPLPIPANPWLIGQRLHVQWAWAGPTSPPPCPPLGISASRALGVTFQK